MRLFNFDEDLVTADPASCTSAFCPFRPPCCDKYGRDLGSKHKCLYPRQPCALFIIMAGNRTHLVNMEHGEPPQLNEGSVGAKHQHHRGERNWRYIGAERSLFCMLAGLWPVVECLAFAYGTASPICGSVI